MTIIFLIAGLGLWILASVTFALALIVCTRGCEDDSP